MRIQTKLEAVRISDTAKKLEYIQTYKQWLRLSRELIGMTAKEIAEESYIGNVSISYYESLYCVASEDYITYLTDKIKLILRNKVKDYVDDIYNGDNNIPRVIRNG